MLIVLGVLIGRIDASFARELRVCADPDNLPYSHRDESGFENRIAALVAGELRAALKYEWLSDRRGFVRKTLNAGLCDVIIGVPREMEIVRTTVPYYRSTYVFVYRTDVSPFRDFDDARLAGSRIGVQLVGNDLAATPPGHALARHGYVRNVVGYTVYGGSAQGMMAALAEGKLDVALVWGPQAGYFVQRERVALRLTPAHGEDAAVPFEYSIAMGVRKDDVALQKELNAVIERCRGDIDAILEAYSVPRVERMLSQSHRVLQ